MLLIAYDFSDDKLRPKFAKFLARFGRRLQYSVFEVRYSERVLQNILTVTGADSVIIIPISPADRKKGDTLRKCGK